MKGACLAALVLIAAAGAEAAQVSFEGEAQPGGLLVGRIAPGSTVAVDGKPVRLSEEGFFLVGLGRDAGPRVVIAVTGPDGAKSVQSVAIGKRSYKIDRIDGLPDVQVTPDPEAMKRIAADNAAIARARAADRARPDFASGFVWPVLGRLSGVYGSQRILNGQPRQPHYGVDIAAAKGSPVQAMGDGVVALAVENMFFTGRTVMIDHGHGLTSVYAHMDALSVQAGETVKKGQVIGLVGQSGRVTGAHLHWGAALFSTQLDPALLAVAMPQGQE